MVGVVPACLDTAVVRMPVARRRIDLLRNVRPDHACSRAAVPADIPAHAASPASATAGASSAQNPR